MDARLETYLGEVAAHLHPLPGKRRGEELREMRAHLEAAYAAGLARGQSEEEAARDVLAQFGTPQELGSETVAAWRRGRSRDRRSFWGAAAFSLFVPWLAWNLMVIAEQPFFKQWNVGPDSGAIPGWALAILFATALLAPFLKGGLVGLLFPRLGRARLGLAVGGGCVFFGLLTGFGPSILIDVPIAVLSAWAVSRWRWRRLERGYGGGIPTRLTGSPPSP